jgi:hypothetical protein
MNEKTRKTIEFPSKNFYNTLKAAAVSNGMKIGDFIKKLYEQQYHYEEPEKGED